MNAATDPALPAPTTSAAPFPPPGYQSVNADPRMAGRCCHPHCRKFAAVDLYAAAGPEFGELRPTDQSQVLVIHPVCGTHAARMMRFSEAGSLAYGPAIYDGVERFARGDDWVAW